MRKGRSTKFALVSCLTATLLTVGGVYATWRYAGDIESHTTQIQNVAMGEWDPEVVLPGGEQEEVDGTSHSILIEQILNNSNAGLNPKPKVLIDAIDSGKNPYRSQRIMFSQMHNNVTGGHLKFLFEGEIVNLDFVLQEIEEAKSYYAYTFNDVLTNERRYVTVFKTLLVKEGKWIAGGTSVGYAEIGTFDIGEGDFYSIQVDTWTLGDAPY